MIWLLSVEHAKCVPGASWSLCACCVPALGLHAGTMPLSACVRGQHLYMQPSPGRNVPRYVAGGLHACLACRL